MSQELPPYQKANVIVVGDVMLDRYWYGQTSRVSPEAPVPIVSVKSMDERLGGAANVAVNIRTLGAYTTVLGIVGEDNEADRLSEKISHAKIAFYLHRQADVPTITKLRMVSLNQQLLRADFEESLQAVDQVSLHKHCQQIISNAQLMILSDYGKGTLAEPQHYIAMARAAKIPVIVDPKGQDFKRYQGATLITPNRKEFEAVVGACFSDQDIVEKGRQLMRECEIENLLITRGAEGMTLIPQEGEEVHLPTRAREVFDVTGAGDTVIAVMGASMAAGCDLVRATMLANLAAGIVVSHVGTASINPDELRHALNKHYGDNDGVMTENMVLDAVTVVRRRKEKIVMTNGCFDILHKGHIDYLQKAKALGDRLIVAVNDDQSVQRLKGALRPINPLNDRMAMLAALACVDWVVPFSEDTPQQLITRIMPDVLTKGGDYQVSDIAGAKEVLAEGGEVKILAFLPNYSTSKLLEKITAIAKSAQGDAPVIASAAKV